MAIGADAVVEFFGTTDTVTSSPATVANDAFSVAGDVSSWTNDDDAVMATAILTLTAAGLGGAPDAHAAVDLYGRLMDIQSTNDQPVPDANFQHTYLGTFPVNDADADQDIAIEIPLPNTKTSQIYEFYIYNRTGVALGTTWELRITPKALGPHA